MKALWYKGYTTLNFTKTSSSWYTGMTTFHISAKSYSWTLFKHQTGASPLPFSWGTNASRFTSRYFRIPSVYSADYRAKYIIEKNRERTRYAVHSSPLHKHLTFIYSSWTYWKIGITQAPTSPPVCLFQDGGLRHCVTIDSSSLIPLISHSSWRNGAGTLETVKNPKTWKVRSLIFQLAIMDPR